MDDVVSENRLGVEPILPLLIKLSIPSIISMGIQALYNVVDSVYVGQFSKVGLSALSLAFPLQIVLISIAVGTGVGASSLISRRLGQGQTRKASSAAEHALLLAGFYGLIIALIGAFFSRHLIGLFTSDPVLIDLASEYIRIIAIGSVFLYVPMLGNNILRGEGNTFVPMISMLIGSIINIILDPFLIFGIGFFPELGVAGAAYATVFGRFVSGIYIVYKLLTNKGDLQLDFKTFKFDFSIIKGIFKVGLPAILMQSLASVMVGALNIIVGSQSDDVLAVVGIYFRLQNFVFMPVFGLNQGFMPIVGYNYGNKNIGRMKQAIKYGLIVGGTITTLGFILFQLIPTAFITMFNKDPNLVSIGVQALRIISFSFPMAGLLIVASTAFQAIGRGFISMALSFTRQIIFLIPLAYIFNQISGFRTAWYAFPIAESLAFVIFIFLFKKIFTDLFDQMGTTRG